MDLLLPAQSFSIFPRLGAGDSSGHTERHATRSRVRGWKLVKHGVVKALANFKISLANFAWLLYNIALPVKWLCAGG
jgi:hypothetical protein